MSTSIQFSRANGEVTFIFDLSLSLKRQAFFGEFVPLFSPRPHLHKNRSFEYKTAALLLQLTFLRILEREREEWKNFASHGQAIQSNVVFDKAIFTE